MNILLSETAEKFLLVVSSPKNYCADRSQLF